MMSENLAALSKYIINQLGPGMGLTEKQISETQ
jgi:hypothetical protein